MGKLHRENLRRSSETLEMIPDQDQEELALLRRPVTANSLKAAGSVLKPVGEEANLCLVVALEPAVGVNGNRRKIHLPCLLSRSRAASCVHRFQAPLAKGRATPRHPLRISVPAQWGGANRHAN